MDDCSFNGELGRQQKVILDYKVNHEISVTTDNNELTHYRSDALINQVEWGLTTVFDEWFRLGVTAVRQVTLVADKVELVTPYRYFVNLLCSKCEPQEELSFESYGQKAPYLICFGCGWTLSLSRFKTSLILEEDQSWASLPLAAYTEGFWEEGAFPDKKEGIPGKPILDDWIRLLTPIPLLEAKLIGIQLEEELVKLLASLQQDMNGWNALARQ